MGNFNFDLPIGQFIESTDDSIEIKIQAWFNWDSLGSSSTTAFELSSISVEGGFDLEWDENPVCESLGPQNFLEDGGGILIPFINNCYDDRTSNENLSVVFEVEDESLISVDHQNETFEYYTSSDFNTNSKISDPTIFTNDAFNQSKRF